MNLGSFSIVQKPGALYSVQYLFLKFCHAFLFCCIYCDDRSLNVTASWTKTSVNHSPKGIPNYSLFFNAVWYAYYLICCDITWKKEKTLSYFVHTAGAAVMEKDWMKSLLSEITNWKLPWLQFWSMRGENRQWYQFLLVMVDLDPMWHFALEGWMKKISFHECLGVLVASPCVLVLEIIVFWEDPLVLEQWILGTESVASFTFNQHLYANMCFWCSLSSKSLVVPHT